MKPIAVLGAGSFGTALACLLAGKGHPVRLWARREDTAREINERHRNPGYLTHVDLPESIHATHRMAEATQGADIVVLVTPTHAIRETLGWANAIPAEATLLCASKGIEDGTFFTPTQIAREVMPSASGRIAALSGPSFAKEIVAGVPTAVTIASDHPEVAARLQSVFSTPTFRAYTSSDLIGVELGGALKNVIAIAAGICDGLQFGHNARAALITRGLAEITRMAARLGANPLTLAGLAGLGDLVLTCTGDLSRNRTVGMRLGQGETLDAILADMKMVAEGVHTAKSACHLSRARKVEMPITEKVYSVLYEKLPPRRAVEELMTRELKAETTG